MANPADITLLAAAVQTAAGDGAELDLGTLRRAVKVEIPVTAFVLDAPPPSEPPSLSISIETRRTSAEPWASLTTLEVESTGRYTLSAGDLERFIRVSWELGTGLDQAEFGVAGQAHVVYCDPRDLIRVVLARSIEKFTASERAEVCIAVSDEADGYVGGAYELPLVAWPQDLRLHTARLGAAALFSARGVDPQGPDANVLLERDRAIKWFDRLANGRLSPPGLIDSTPEENEGGSVVVSNPSRRW